MRDSGPISTTPGRAGFLAAGFGRGLFLRGRGGDAGDQRHAHAALRRAPQIPATSASRHRRWSWPAPARRRSGHRTARGPARRSCPCASSLPTLSVTACPAMLLPIRSRTTRTVTVRSGSSGAGSGVPAIADGSGISTCALAALAREQARSQIARSARADVFTASPRSSCRTSRRDRFVFRTPHMTFGERQLQLSLMHLASWRRLKPSPSKRR